MKKRTLKKLLKILKPFAIAYGVRKFGEPWPLADQDVKVASNFYVKLQRKLRQKRIKRASRPKSLQDS